MTFRYVHEKTYNAARALAIPDADLTTRLQDAYAAGLSRLDGEFDDNSRELEAEWQAVVDAVDQTDAETDRIRAALEEMGDAGRHDLAEAIMDLYGHVEQEWARREVAGTQYD